MSNKPPTRSEIESALSADTKSRSTQNRKQPTFNDKDRLRKQRVLGGDLGGIKKTKTAKINYLNWVAGIVVVLIMVAFFWPVPQDKPVSEIAGKESPQAIEPIYTESRIEIEKEEDAKVDETFTRENDLQRADDYRLNEAHERQINLLVSKAEANIKSGNYTQPEQDNALAKYRKILEIDANNRKAKQGIDYIKRRFITSGIEAINADNLKAANDALGKLASVDNQSSEYRQLQTEIENWKRSQQIQQALAKADDAFTKEKYILPASDNALFYFQQALTLDPDNQNAQKGVAQIANTYIKLANEAILEGEYEAATGYLTTASVIQPDNESINLLKDMITNAKTLNSQREANLAESGSEKKETKESNTLDKNNKTAFTRDVIEATKPPSTGASAKTEFSLARTPIKESAEQAEIDKQYLNRGLSAYYMGDYDTALAMLQPLADKGVSRAQFRIGYMYFLGRGVEKNKKEADRIIRAALPAVQKFADEGRPWAQSDIGSLYEDGLVQPKDYSEAIYWYRRAAEQGYPGAQTNLGIMYAYGRGVTSSRKTAIDWFKKAAQQGDIAAKRNLEALGIN